MKRVAASGSVGASLLQVEVEADNVFREPDDNVFEIAPSSGATRGAARIVEELSPALVDGSPVVVPPKADDAGTTGGGVGVAAKRLRGTRRAVAMIAAPIPVRSPVPVTVVSRAVPIVAP